MELLKSWIHLPFIYFMCFINTPCCNKRKFPLKRIRILRVKAANVGDFRRLKKTGVYFAESALNNLQDGVYILLLLRSCLFINDRFPLQAIGEIDFRVDSHQLQLGPAAL